MTHSLTLGGLLLTDPMPDVDHGFVFSVLAEGAGFGVAQSVQEVVRSLLADGDLMRTTRYGNREVSFKVQIEGPSLNAVASGEAALRREVGRANTLTWQAPDLFSVPTVFEVVASEMSQSFDDLDELRKRRVFTLTLTCAPFARSAEPVVIEAMVSGSTTVTVDTCDSVTGWDGYRNGFPYAASTAWEAGSVGVAEFEAAITGPDVWRMTRTGAVDFTSTPYLKVEVRTIASDVGSPMNVQAYAASSEDPAALLPVLSIRSIPGSAYEVVYDATGFGSVPALTFSHTSTAGHVWQGMFIRSLARTDVAPNFTSRQLTRIVTAGGTERTPGSIHVFSGDELAYLELAMVHTCPEDASGYSPPLRSRRVSGQTVEPDGGLVSGFYESITGGGVTFDIPTTALPEGGYVLAARMRRSSEGAVDIAWSTSTVFPGGSVEQGFTNGTESVLLPDTDWHIVPLAALSLPSVRTKAGTVRTIIQAPVTGGAITYLDEAWLFRVGDDCALTIVEGTVAPHLWLNSPGVDGPVPTVWTGDRAQTRVHPGESLKAMGSHVFSPEGTAVFTASLLPNPLTDVTLFRRWHSNAAS